MKLAVLDPRTHVRLWSITEHMARAILKGNRDKEFERALSALMDDVIRLSARPITASGGAPQ